MDRRQNRLLVLLDEAGNVIEVLARALRLARQAVDLRHDAALFGKWGKAETNTFDITFAN